MDGALPYRRCAGVVLLNPQGLVFAGRRADATDAWQMPQGGIDEGETPFEAACRELVEETGIAGAEPLGETAGWLTYDLPAELVGKALRGRYRGQRQKWFAMRFTGRDEAIDVRTAAHPEFDAWRWMTGSELVEAIVPFKRDVYRRIFAEFGDLIA